VVTVFGAILLALACVCWLLYFIHHVSQSISVNQIVDKIASETEAMIKEMMPALRRRAVLLKHDPLATQPFELTIVSDRSGYIRFVDLGRLLVLATSHRIAVQVMRRVGHFVPAGVPIMRVSKPERLPPDAAAMLLDAFDLGPSRTLQQDIEFGVLQIVDIALRAISPAVNDPSTAISCVDQLSRVLIQFAAREPPESVLYDRAGAARVGMDWIDFERLLDSAFEQIRLYSQSDVAVSLRLLRALGDIAYTTEDREFRRTLAERGRRIFAGCATRLGEDEVKEMRSRLGALQSLVDRQESATPAAS